MNNIAKSKQNNSDGHKYGKENGIVVKKIEDLKPEIDEIEYILIDVFEGCRETFFIRLEIDLCMLKKLRIRVMVK